ncbi:hypothetical protein NW762_012692 [Fusarium torreyae]|uniref:Uncharacterized protein n=1 Tax=Fusarium torreyae TaxID=1237075 RepID=A0A9W8RQE9_9HYPO|nr:hypothetical protein NW762_012692 [Fusarium torreyae]
MNTSEPTLACPSDESRAEKELIVKIVVAHLTAAVAFCNFLSLRNEKLTSIEPVLFLLSPFIVVFQTILGLVVINVASIYNIVFISRSFREHVDAYARQWSILFGRKPDSNTGVKRSPTESLESQENTTRSKLGKAWVRLGSSATTFGTLFQCVSTIFLYKRRYELHGWDSLTIVDYRTFELAVGGAFVSVLSLAFLLRLPGFGYAPETEYRSTEEAPEEPIILFFRGDTRRCPRWYQFYTSDHGHHSSMLAWFLCVCSATYRGQVLIPRVYGGVYAAMHQMVMEKFSLDISVTRFYVYVGIFLVVAFTMSKIYLLIDKAASCSALVLLPFMLIVAGVAIAFFCMWLMMLAPLVVVSFLPVVNGPLCAFGLKGYEVQQMLSQPPFVPPMNETECLALWKDPMAEYLWSLV